MAGNKSLQRAARIQQDEFYTSTFDIENELVHYREHFRGKKIFCNCDDPFESKFFEYFALSFNQLNLARLTATCYAGSPTAHRQLTLGFEESNTPRKQRKPYCAVVEKFRDYNEGRSLRELNGDGDFRSPECIDLLKDADIVVTNPPFSLLKEYVALLMKHEKKFVIVGNINAITYKEIFPLFMQNKMWFGYGFKGGQAHFTIPSIEDPEQYKDYNPKTGQVSLRNCCWFTNLEIKKRKEEIFLFKNYSPELYPKYDNYDAIEVSRIDSIPCDYDGVMGVPVTFLQRYNPEQFAVIGCSYAHGDPGCHVSGTSWNPRLNGKEIYKRLFIRKI